MKAIAICMVAGLLASAGCKGSPFDRPATLVDPSDFPPELRGAILPTGAFHGGQAINYFLLESATGAINDAVFLVDGNGEPLAPCRTLQRDQNGVLTDTDLSACQGVMLSQLPGDPFYSPYVRRLEATAPRGYELNSLRSVDEVEQAGLTPVDSGRVVDLAIVDPAATVADPTMQITRLVGWMDTLELVYLDMRADLPTEGNAVTPMRLYVPDGAEPGDGGEILEHRAGEEGYSTLCEIVYFSVPGDYQAGDIADAVDIDPTAIIDSGSDPALVHCVAP